MGQKIGPILLLIALLLIALNSAFYTVDQSEHALVLQLGKPVREKVGPGLHIKIPFIQEVIYFESRLLDYDAAPAEILTADKKNVRVASYAKWRIVNPLDFYNTLRSMEGALLRLDDIIYAEIRMELGRHTMVDILSRHRRDIMDAITKRSDAYALKYGISVVDVRIKRADLPRENENAVYGRMKAERERQAREYRSEGREEAVKIKAGAEEERAVILAEAYRKAQVIQGEGDAKATQIYAGAYGQDPDFFNLLRTLETSRKALKDNTVLVVSPEYEFLQFMKSSGATPDLDREGEPKHPALPMR
jgi:membrane protease subunit HflC